MENVVKKCCVKVFILICRHIYTIKAYFAYLSKLLKVIANKDFLKKFVNILREKSLKGKN
jgi:hypothetical protein